MKKFSFIVGKELEKGVCKWRVTVFANHLNGAVRQVFQNEDINRIVEIL